jgi:hypothetical protein
MAAIKPKARDDLAVVELDGELVIYDEEQGNLHHLNPTASLVFSLFDGSATVKEHARDIANVYGMPIEEIEQQIRALIRQFRKSGLLMPSQAVS